MEAFNMKELLEEKFEDDPIYKEVQILNLEKELYTDKILNMHPETTYSTVEAGKIVGRPDSTIRNYFRSDLIDYIQPEKMGKFYRLNYISVFKFQMILTLIDKGGKSLNDIAYATGLRASSMASFSKINKKSEDTNNNQSLQNFSDGAQIEERLNNMERLMAYLKLKTDHGDQLRQLQGIEYEIQLAERDLKLLDNELSLLDARQETKFFEHKHNTILDYSLRKTIETKTPKNQGFFASLFSKKNEDHVSADEILKDARQKADAENSHEDDYELQREDIEKQINAIQEKLKSLNAKKDQLEDLTGETNSKLLAFNQINALENSNEEG
ncbi:hypothetical protein [Bacillus swezeyi]|uniref:Uncharacterized protein n=1 Tax=Bacillus swezeyi TaxID=1925020 RepID=A0A5M8RJ83_9BACI|nr:hypothetical protein [Bacillus swezeyi]KAA6446904.1 hypothetical protein DX927_22895 [Bacillus swezeyi]KAA6471472.1 hypothetical protein DX928_23135 [Bacillus swezeyi]